MSDDTELSDLHDVFRQVLGWSGESRRNRDLRALAFRASSALIWPPLIGGATQLRAGDGPEACYGGLRHRDRVVCGEQLS
jgi:hypothetical protein